MSITGPESTGKTSLARELSSHYHTLWVPEYSRDYLNGLGRPYSADDIARICTKQIELEEEFSQKANQILFCDTDALVCKIWSEEKFGYCQPFIEKAFRQNIYELYLLCFPDLPWQPDPLRENPHDRGRLFELYREQLENSKLRFTVISGTGAARLALAIRAVNEVLD